LYEVYDLAVLTAATLSTTGLSLTATRGEFIVVFHALHALRSFFTALLAMLAGLLTALLAATISSLAALLTTASG
jgi:uncharacterized membrane protein